MESGARLAVVTTAACVGVDILEYNVEVLQVGSRVGHKASQILESWTIRCPCN